MDNILNVNNDLWDVIEKKYADEHYTNAILDSINYLGGVIREKANTTLDGDEMAKYVFSLNNPKIKLNKLQSKSEKSIQKGAMESISGLYSLIRNPRSHNIEKDSKKDADAIIKYIDYLLGLIIEADTNFSIDDFIEDVKDKHFVDSDEYAELLFNEIPEEKRYDSLLAMYYGLDSFLKAKHKSLFQKLINSIVSEQRKDFLSIVSKDLQVTTKKSYVEKLLMIISSNDWAEISLRSRIRIEGIILECIEYSTDADWFEDFHSLATFSATRINDFTNSSEIKDVIVSNIEKEDYDNMMFLHYWDIISEVSAEGRFRPEFKSYIITRLEKLDNRVIERIGRILESEEKESIWNIEFGDLYETAVRLIT